MGTCDDTQTDGLRVRACLEGASFVAETLRSILDQEGVNFIVRISVDGADEESADACSAFLSDDRVELTVQPKRFGWVKNTAWLLGRAHGDYVCIQPHDDLVAENYLQTLLDVAAATPEAAVVYSDIESFGDRLGIIKQASVVGSPLARQLGLLLDYRGAVAFRGLTRTSAITKVGLLAGSPCRDYAADTVWMAQLARAGELHRVPLPLYRKRYHAGNTHSAWQNWNREEKIAAWGQHCADMLAQALAIGGLHGTERAILARAATLRASRAFGFADSGKFSEEERRKMMVAFCDAATVTVGTRWKQIFLGSEDLIINDILEACPYPSIERELQYVQRDLEDALARLAEIEKSTAWRFGHTCSRAASRLPFARALARRIRPRLPDS